MAFRVMEKKMKIQPKECQVPVNITVLDKCMYVLCALC